MVVKFEYTLMAAVAIVTNIVTYELAHELGASEQRRNTEVIDFNTGHYYGTCAKWNSKRFCAHDKTLDEKGNPKVSQLLPCDPKLVWYIPADGTVQEIMNMQERCGYIRDDKGVWTFNLK